MNDWTVSLALIAAVIAIGFALALRRDTPGEIDEWTDAHYEPPPIPTYTPRPPRRAYITKDDINWEIR